MGSAHIVAEKADFAETVLMPGDPLRSRFIAQNFLQDAKLVNDIRGIQGYTGFYKGERVSVMASGMGMPSMGIYSYELFHDFKVKNIIRIGTIGALTLEVELRDLILAMSASTDSHFAQQYHLTGTYAPTADFTMLRTMVEICEKYAYCYHVGNILSSDLFYDEHPENMISWLKMGVLGVDMEAAALYMNAARLKKRALAVMTVSNHVITGEETTAEERQNGFTEMMQVALDTAVAMKDR